LFEVSANIAYSSTHRASYPETATVQSRLPLQPLPERHVSLQSRWAHDSLNRRRETMDVLSEALNSVRMTGAIFADLICAAPWGLAIPGVEPLAETLAPGTECIVGFHLVVEGKALVGLEGAEDVPVEAGDLVIIPHGDPHTITNGASPRLVPPRVVSGTVDKWLAGDISPLRIGGGGELTRFVCGYFGCERHAARLFLAGLPPVIRINIRTDASGEWLERSIRHLRGEAASGRPGRMVLLSKMAEALFIEALRRYIEQLSPESSGWLAGARDPVVGSVLAMMHRMPGHPWTVAELAAEAGASRSLLTQRFARFLGEPPLTYLAHWRLQLAAKLLRTTHKTIVQVAFDVGYESGAAFSRAFKREFGLPPAQYRHKLTRKVAGPPARSPRDADRSGVKRPT
jgi:AraC-like DNA-binding protein